MNIPSGPRSSPGRCRDHCASTAAIESGRGAALTATRLCRLRAAAVATVGHSLRSCIVHGSDLRRGDSSLSNYLVLKTPIPRARLRSAGLLVQKGEMP